MTGPRALVWMNAVEAVTDALPDLPRPRPVAPLNAFERRGILVAAALMIPPGALALLLGWPWQVTLPGTALVAAVQASRLVRSWRIRNWENVGEASGLLVFIAFAVAAGFGHGSAFVAALAVALPTVLWMAWSHRRDERRYRALADAQRRYWFGDVGER